MITEAKRFFLNRMNSTARDTQMGTELSRTVSNFKAVYDFSVSGGAVGTINLKDQDGLDAKLPSGAIITFVLIDVITAPTSGGAATIAITANSAADLKAATAIASYTGLVAGIPVNSAATSIKLTAERTLSITVATAALTAGKFNVFVEYVLGN